MPRFQRLLLLCSLTLVPSAPAVAAEGEEVVKAQKAAAEANLKATAVKHASAETTDLLVYGGFPEAKVKAYAAVLQKSFASGTRILKAKPEDKLWNGKLTVYLLADARDAKALVQHIERKTVDRRDVYRVSVRGETPFVILPLQTGAKANDAAIVAEAAAYVGAAVLGAKIGGTSPPEWMLLGFGRVAHVRADGPTSARMTAHKQKVKSLLAKTRGQAFRWSVVEGGQGGTDQELLAASLVEFLAFGPNADKFSALVGALKPGENGESPSFAQALQTLEWPADQFDAAWQKWVVTGK